MENYKTLCLLFIWGHIFQRELYRRYKNHSLEKCPSTKPNETKLYIFLENASFKSKMDQGHLNVVYELQIGRSLSLSTYICQAGNSGELIHAEWCLEYKVF